MAKHYNKQLSAFPSSIVPSEVWGEWNLMHFCVRAAVILSRFRNTTLKILFHSTPTSIRFRFALKLSFSTVSVTSVSTQQTSRWSHSSLKPTVYALNLWDSTRMVPFIGISSAQDCIARTFQRERSRHKTIESGRSFVSLNKIGRIWRINLKVQNQKKKLLYTEFWKKIFCQAFRFSLRRRKLKDDEGKINEFNKINKISLEKFQTFPTSLIATSQINCWTSQR